MHKNIKLQMFAIVTSLPSYTQIIFQIIKIIKNKNLPFVKTKNRNALNVQIKKHLNAICP